VVVVGEGSTGGRVAGTGGTTVGGTVDDGAVVGGTVGTDLGGEGRVVTGACAGRLGRPEALAPTVKTPAQIGRARTMTPTKKRAP
jgi:hypothetical protein